MINYIKVGIPLSSRCSHNNIRYIELVINNPLRLKLFPFTPTSTDKKTTTDIKSPVATATIPMTDDAKEPLPTDASQQQPQSAIPSITANGCFSCCSDHSTPSVIDHTRLIN